MRRWMWSALLVPSIALAQNPMPPAGGQPRPGGPGGPGGPGAPQAGDTGINLKVFPHGTPRTQIVPVMQGFTQALGVDCEFCHMPGATPNARLNFPADDKRTKQTARIMMRMVADINRRLDSIPGRLTPNVAVTCATCHRGISRPMPLGQAIGTAVAVSADSAQRTYTALHDKYYGSAAYDFSERSLISPAIAMARDGHTDGALAMLRISNGAYPQSPAPLDAMAEVYLMRGDTAGALDEFRAALQRDSTDRQARGRLRMLTGGGPGGAAPQRP